MEEIRIITLFPFSSQATPTTLLLPHLLKSRLSRSPVSYVIYDELNPHHIQPYFQRAMNHVPLTVMSLTSNDTHPLNDTHPPPFTGPSLHPMRAHSLLPGH